MTIYPSAIAPAKKIGPDLTSIDLIRAGSV